MYMYSPWQHSVVVLDSPFATEASIHVMSIVLWLSTEHTGMFTVAIEVEVPLTILVRRSTKGGSSRGSSNPVKVRVSRILYWGMSHVVSVDSATHVNTMPVSPGQAHSPSSSEDVNCTAAKAEEKTKHQHGLIPQVSQLHYVCQSPHLETNTYK